MPYSVILKYSRKGKKAKEKGTKPTKMFPLPFVLIYIRVTTGYNEIVTIIQKQRQRKQN